MNGSQDLYIRVLLIIDILQASRMISWLKAVSEFFSNSWLQSREPALLAVIARSVKQ